MPLQIMGVGLWRLVPQAFLMRGEQMPPGCKTIACNSVIKCEQIKVHIEKKWITDKTVQSQHLQFSACEIRVVICIHTILVVIGPNLLGL